MTVHHTGRRRVNQSKAGLLHETAGISLMAVTRSALFVAKNIHLRFGRWQGLQE
jgi:hypothetical protein